MGVDLRSSRTDARSLFAGKAVLRAVLIVLTCLSIKPFDLGKWGGGGMVLYAVMCEEFCELIQSKQ